MSIGASIAEFITEQFNISPLAGEIIVSVMMFILAIIVGWIVYHIFERYLTRWAEKTKTKLDDEILRNIKKPIYFFVILVGAFYGLEFLSFLKPFASELAIIFTLAEIFLVTFIITRVVNVVVVWYAERRADKKRMSEHLLFIMKKILNAIIYLFAFLFILHVFKVDLTGAVVGLGVGGIAIALALQNVLSDVFSAFAIYFDKPFEIGDFIIIGNDMGIVKKIGIKSTRIQSLQGEELVVSNNELINARIQNFKKMRKRRIVFKFGVTYDTPLKKLEKIPEIIRDIIDKENLSHVHKLDRVHFKEFGDFSLNFEVVYYLATGDYNTYMDTQQEINFAIKEAFEKEGIEMAFPTQTIFLNK